MKVKDLFYKKSLKDPCAVTLALWFLGQHMTDECKNRISELLMEQEITFKREPWSPSGEIIQSFVAATANVCSPNKLAAAWHKQGKANEVAR